MEPEPVPTRRCQKQLTPSTAVLGCWDRGRAVRSFPLCRKLVHIGRRQPDNDDQQFNEGKAVVALPSSSHGIIPMQCADSGPIRQEQHATRDHDGCRPGADAVHSA